MTSTEISFIRHIGLYTSAVLLLPTILALHSDFRDFNDAVCHKESHSTGNLESSRFCRDTEPLKYVKLPLSQVASEMTVQAA